MNKQDDQIAFVIFLGVVFLLPLPLGSNRPWFWLFEAVLVFSLLALCCMQVARQRWEWSSQLKAIHWPMRILAMWLLYGLIQLLPLPQTWLSHQGSSLFAGWASVSVDWHASAVRWLQSLFLSALFVLSLHFLRYRSRLKTLIAVMLIAGLLQAMWGALMTLSGVEWGVFGPKEYGRGLATGTFINRNHFAGFLVLCLSLGIGRLISLMNSRYGRRSLRQIIRDWLEVLMGPKMRIRLYLVVMVIALVLSRSRMGNTAFFSSLMFSGLLALFLMKKPSRSLIALLVSLLLIDVFIVGTWFGFEKVVTRIQQTGQYEPDTGRYQDQDRLNVDQETLAATKNFFIIGSGAGSFYTVFPAYRPAEIRNYFDHAHNDYLEILLEYGLIGLIIISSWLLLALYSAVRAIRINRDRLLIGIGFAALMSIVAFLMHSAVDFNLHIPSNAAYFVIILALGHIAAGRKVING